MTRNRDQNAPSQLARDIQRRLAEAQDAASQPPVPEPPPAAVQGLIVTKSGEIIPPGQEVPRDQDGNAVAHSVIPDATFRDREQRALR
jgi:hypothetical protein